VKPLFIFLARLVVAAAGALSPAEIQARIQSQGGHKVLWALWDNQTEWNQLFAGIASGKSDWLKIAQVLHPFSDAAASEDIHNAVITPAAHRMRDKKPETLKKRIIPPQATKFQVYKSASGQISACFTPLRENRP